MLPLWIFYFISVLFLLCFRVRAPLFIDAYISIYSATCGSGQKVKTFLTESSHVAYQIKGNGTQSKCKYTFCPYSTRWGQKVKLFLLKVVMLHIKLNGMEHRVPCKHIFCPYTNPRPMGWGQMSNHFFLKVVMLHIKLIGIELRAPCKHISCPYTHP